MNELEKRARAQITKETEVVSKTLVVRVIRWIESAPTWHLVALYAATYPLSWIEAVLIDLLGIVPGLGILLDGVLHTVDETYLLLPILISVELARRLVKGALSPLRRIGKRNKRDVIDSDDI